MQHRKPSCPTDDTCNTIAFIFLRNQNTGQLTFISQHYTVAVDQEIYEAQPYSSSARSQEVTGKVQVIVWGLDIDYDLYHGIDDGV